MNKVVVAMGLLMLSASVALGDWWYTYEANGTYPEDEGWSRIAMGGGAQRSFEDGALVLDGSASIDICDAYAKGMPSLPDPNDPTSPFVCEWRLCVDWVSPFSRDPGVHLIFEGFGSINLQYKVDQVCSLYEFEYIADFEPGVFHTYVLTTSNMQTYTLAIDGSVVWNGDLCPYGPASVLQFGDLLVGSASKSRWDYVRFGVPEPGSILLLVAAVLGLRNRGGRGYRGHLVSPRKKGSWAMTTHSCVRLLAAVVFGLFGTATMWASSPPAPKVLGNHGYRTSPEMVGVAGGDFQMGDPWNEGGTDERPVHTVYISSFYIDASEVTNQQYADGLNWAWAQGGLITVTNAVVYKYGSGTSYAYCDTTTSSPYSRITWDGSTFAVLPDKETHPATEVSWYGAVAYCNWRSAREGKPLCYDLSNWSCNFAVPGYRLATEAEWEKAAGWDPAEQKHFRFGGHTDGCGYDCLDGYGANYWNSGDPFESGTYPWSTPVGFYDGTTHGAYPTEDARSYYGCYDMSGNVWEWCYDWYSSGYYSNSPSTDPTGPPSGIWRVVRGGGWANNPASSRSAKRGPDGPSDRDVNIGFRCAVKVMIGDLNFDGRVDFGDINPFVLYLADFASWQAVYPDCPPANGDINADGLYPDFADINPFVALLTGGL